MLTKNDLQAIREIVDERLDAKLEEKLDKKLRPIKRNITKIKKNTETLIDHFDKRDIQLQKRVKRIEAHLNLPQTS